MKKSLLALVLGTVGLLGSQAAFAQPTPREAPPDHTPVPTIGLPGGWSAHPVDDSVKATAADAARLLAGPDWLGRPVQVKSIDRALTQVVAGLNTYVSMQVLVNGKVRPIEVVVYQPLQGPATVSWMRLESAPR